jgi:biopolymer transport protein ExbD
MSGWKPIGVGVSARGAPAADLRAALLLMTMIMTIVFVPFALVVGPRLDQVTLELHQWPDFVSPTGIHHRLEVTAQGRILLDGKLRSDLVELRMSLDSIALERGAVVELQPDPEMRYGRFLEVLATAERAGLPHLLVTGDGGGYWPPPLRL